MKLYLDVVSWLKFPRFVCKYDESISVFTRDDTHKSSMSIYELLYTGVPDNLKQKIIITLAYIALSESSLSHIIKTPH